MPELPSTPRPSTKETLEDLYNGTGASKYTQGVPGDNGTAGVRSTIKDKGIGIQAWAWNKRAGNQGATNPLSPYSQMGPHSGDSIDGTPPGQSPRDWAQTGFATKQTSKVTQFTKNGLNYAKTIGVKADKYR